MKLLARVVTVDVLGVDMISEIVSGLFQNFRLQVTQTFTGGNNGLSVNRISREDAARLQLEAQEAKDAVEPTVAGFNAKAEKIRAESAMTVAGMNFVGASAEVFTEQIESVADLSDAMVEASPRVQAALARLSQNVQVLGNEYESIMFGSAQVQQNTQAIAQSPQPKMLFASR